MLILTFQINHSHLALQQSVFYSTITFIDLSDFAFLDTFCLINQWFFVYLRVSIVGTVEETELDFNQSTTVTSSSRWK